MRPRRTVNRVVVARWCVEDAPPTLLAERPVWLFSRGSTGQGDPAALLQGWRFPKSLQPIADRIHARDIAVFHGAVDMNKLNLIERWMAKNVKSPIGDFRDWDAISAWAGAIAEVLLRASPWATMTSDRSIPPPGGNDLTTS